MEFFFLFYNYIHITYNHDSVMYFNMYRYEFVCDLSYKGLANGHYVDVTHNIKYSRKHKAICL